LMPCINQAKWESLTADQQSAVKEAMEYAIAYNDKTRLETEAGIVSFFEGEGLKVTYPDITEFRDNVQAAYAANTAMTSSWDMDLYKQVQDMAK
ncbi:MAG: C4-dicarboxylate ABC transporter substrate-binding protein, partial [Spirochaetales bacterium]|nr:C4-dicarboxylate ABC transporter substrate-binding protein [Spirochaetales bacterium]